MYVYNCFGLDSEVRYLMQKKKKQVNLSNKVKIKKKKNKKNSPDTRFW